jgi:glutamate-1-semialdehyde 2,1-aminomutase
MESKELVRRAALAMPGGVNSPVRAFRAVGGEPLIVRSAAGALLETEDGRRLIDFCMSFGPLILGHAHPAVTEAIAKAAEKGTSYAVTTRAEVEMAELLQGAVPSMKRVRLVSSGTEAAMTAVRLARGFTGRSKILKFSGCYHGHADSMLVQAGSGVADLAEASSAGVPPSFAKETLVVPYNDGEAVWHAVEVHGRELAAIIVEPVAANMGLVLPRSGFLQELRRQCDLCGALLIFDEVITGFRLHFGGYQDLCGVCPDLTCLGKIIGGGLPIGALGGRADVMEQLAPLGPVYQAGTLSGNPVCVAAGMAVLGLLKDTKPYAALAEWTCGFVDAIESVARGYGVSLQIPRIGSMFSLFFSGMPVASFEDVKKSQSQDFVPLFQKLLAAGVYLPPSPFEVSFLSTAHDQSCLERAGDAFRQALSSC